MKSVVETGMAEAAQAPDLATLLIWAGEVADRPLGKPERLSVGASRAMYILPREGEADLVLRVDTGGGPFAGTDLTLRREAELYHGLSPHYGSIPRFIEMHPSGLAFLMERVDGTHDLATLDPNARERVCEGLVEALADLHALDAVAFDLPSFERGKAPRDHALIELARWRGMLDRFDPQEVAPGLCMAEILHSCAPDWHGPPRLCHGDVGPKNFMFVGGRITALVDWEQAHLGDPHDDLAWWVFRGHEWLGAAGDLSAQLRTWSARSGIRLDPASLGWYRALVILRFYIQVRIALLHDVAPQDRLLYLSILPVLDVKLAQAAASLMGVSLGEPDAPRADKPLAAPAAGALSELLGARIALSDQAEERRALASAADFAEHLALVDRFGADIRQQDEAERAAIEQRFGVFSAPGMAPEHRVAVLRATLRRGARHALLWPKTRARAIARPWSPADLDVAAGPSA